MPPGGLLRRAAGLLACSALFRGGKHLIELNQKDHNLQLSKWGKLWSGSYLLLRDYADGLFPPTFADQQQAYLNEINAYRSVPGASDEVVARGEMVKPFWFGPHVRIYLLNFLTFVRALEAAQLRPPAKLLEMGGGTGWMAEFVAQFGFRVLSTTISPYDVEAAGKRVTALRAKGLSEDLSFLEAPMESIAERVRNQGPFDGVFVFEALHHAYDWRVAITSAYGCIRPGGWLLICGEPNVLHTFISYRVGRLANTREIGFRKSELVQHLKQTGFTKIVSLGKRPHFFIRPHWLLAQKPV